MVYSPVVYILRVIHVLIAFFLSACLFYLYYVALTGAEITKYGWGAMTALLAEGIMFLSLRKDCPFSMWQRKYGDQKGFFELFLPPQAARAVFPVLFVISAVPFLLIIGKALR